MGGMTRKIFTELLNHTGQLLDDKELHYLIFDRATAHTAAVDPTENIHAKMPPLYSAFLNPVKQAISCLKANINKGRYFVSSDSTSCR